MTPRFIAEFASDRPELVMLVDQRGDMFSSEEWGAVLSEPGEDGISIYRYLLWRIFDPSLPVLLVVMLNPSVATHLQGDRTIDGLMRRARRFGYGGVVVANCFAFRATEPQVMRKAKDPVGPHNDAVLDLIFAQPLDVLCAWGVNATHLDRERNVTCTMENGTARPHVLRLCAGGAPEHPLYVPAAIAPSPWQPISRKN